MKKSLKINWKFVTRSQRRRSINMMKKRNVTKIKVTKKEKETQEKVALYIIIMKDMIKCQLIMLSCIIDRQLNFRSGDESLGDNDKKDHDKAETPVPQMQDIPQWVHQLNKQSFLHTKILCFK